jgi:enoyl-CoA hydratase
MDYQFLKCEEQEDLAVITLNRPEKRNALSISLREEIVRVLEELENKEEVQAGVLTGAGPTFCAGFDLSEFTEENMEEIFAQAVTYHHKVYTFSKPLIAAVNGPALAGGMDLAIMCDVRIVSETAVFGQPQVRMGIPAAYDLIRTVLPEAIARELCLSGRRMDAQEALRLGLVNSVVAEEKLMDEVLNLARAVAEHKGGQITKGQFIKEQPDLFSA